MMSNWLPWLAFFTRSYNKGFKLGYDKKCLAGSNILEGPGCTMTLYGEDSEKDL